MRVGPCIGIFYSEIAGKDTDMDDHLQPVLKKLLTAPKVRSRPELGTSLARPEVSQESAS